MKRLLFIILLFGVCLTFNRAHAQRCLPGMRGIQLTGGLSDNMRWKNGDGFGYHAGIAVSTYTKNAHHWVVGAEYLEKRYGYRGCLYPASQFTGEGGYYLNFLSDRKKTFFAALGLSALAGYETVNWGGKTLYDGARLNNKDAFVYGCAATLEMELYLVDFIALTASLRERFLWGGSMGVCHTEYGIGVKFIIN